MKTRKVRRPSAPRATRRPTEAVPALVAEWPIPVSAVLGSAVRQTGIEREIRAKLPWATRNCLLVETNRAVLGMAEGRETEFEAVRAVVADVVAGIDTLPVLPREVEDILTITAHERGKWLKDGRLKSVGTRTVKLRGRAKAVTFHVFDPHDVEDALDRDLPTIWREEDARKKAENRKRAATKASLARASGKDTGCKTARAGKLARDGETTKLAGWDAFALEGLLRS